MRHPALSGHVDGDTDVVEREKVEEEVEEEVADEGDGEMGPREMMGMGAPTGRSEGLY
jgi:hypothetical protein